MTEQLMPWYIPIISAVIGAVIGGGIVWVVRHIYDARVERAILRRELFKDYMTLRFEGVPGLIAIQRIGALRLPKKEFDLLVKDLARCGHPPATKKNHSDTEGIEDLYAVLLFAASREEIVAPGESLYDLLRDLKLSHAANT